MSNNLIPIDIVSDVSCPWCIVGYQSLHLAINELNMQESTHLNWRPFELNPNMPLEGQDRAEHLQEKYGASAEQTSINRKNLEDRGKAVGYTFNFADDGRIYNTFNAHRLIYWAKQFEKQTELKLALFDLYFKHNGNPSDEQDLLECVTQVGLEREQAEMVLNSDQYQKQVRDELLLAQQQGISSVPAFIFNNKYLVSGGQPKEVFVQVLQEVSAELAAA